MDLCSFSVARANQKYLLRTPGKGVPLWYRDPIPPVFRSMHEQIKVAKYTKSLST
jgi:hypothetical protein